MLPDDKEDKLPTSHIEKELEQLTKSFDDLQLPGINNVNKNNEDSDQVASLLETHGLHHTLDTLYGDQNDASISNSDEDENDVSEEEVGDDELDGVFGDGEDDDDVFDSSIDELVQSLEHSLQETSSLFDPNADSLSNTMKFFFAHIPRQSIDKMAHDLGIKKRVLKQYLYPFSSKPLSFDNTIASNILKYIISQKDVELKRCQAMSTDRKNMIMEKNKQKKERILQKRIKLARSKPYLIE